jgi:hypothetical protein
MLGRGTDGMPPIAPGSGIGVASGPGGGIGEPSGPAGGMCGMPMWGGDAIGPGGAIMPAAIGCEAP